MPKAVDIRTAIAGLPVLRNRTRETRGPEAAAAFTTLAETAKIGVFAGSFEGESAWERHRNGDELVQVLDGAARLTILTDSSPTVLDMKAGMIAVVPQGCWHKFNAPDVVTVMTMTPLPTDISSAEDSREGGSI
jgi:mannose-6-phosphate isomerase-like protein (cupin superfamily)